MIGKKYSRHGKQTISIGDGCNHVGTILHEMMHAIGEKTSVMSFSKHKRTCFIEIPNRRELNIYTMRIQVFLFFFFFFFFFLDLFWDVLKCTQISVYRAP